MTVQEPAPAPRRTYVSPVVYGGRTLISLILLILAIVYLVVIGLNGDPFHIGWPRNLGWALALFAASFLPI